jgi:hypothetical protein
MTASFPVPLGAFANAPVGMLPLPRSPIEIDCADSAEATNINSMAGTTTALRVVCMGGRVRGKGLGFRVKGLWLRV